MESVSMLKGVLTMDTHTVLLSQIELINKMLAKSNLNNRLFEPNLKCFNRDPLPLTKALS